MRKPCFLTRASGDRSISSSSAAQLNARFTAPMKLCFELFDQSGKRSIALVTWNGLSCRTVSPSGMPSRNRWRFSRYHA
jgi:hypothetical protein